MPAVLLTGATGYIGSHTWLALEAAGFDVLGIDNFSNSSPEVLARLAQLCRRAPAFEQLDVRDTRAVSALLARRRVDAVVHFAALKSVAESTREPLAYYANNVGGLVALCEAMREQGVRRLVYSSSATVYGEPTTLPIREDAPLSTTNPYGATKLAGEHLLRDLEASDGRWKVAYLRYFNPVGAHDSGRIGEDPRGVPNNLMPFVAQVAVGARERLSIFGDDYPTADGTGVRDYIHVMDLAEGHVAALRFLLDEHRSLTVNLGTGRGTSVLELVQAYERAYGHGIARTIAPRRPGDVAACWADVSRAREVLGWSATRDLDTMCADSWRWQRLNPHGYSNS